MGCVSANERAVPRAPRVFVADSAEAEWVELTSDVAPAVRITASDLQQAQRARTRIRSREDSVSVVLDVTVLVAEDYRSARRGMAKEPDDAPDSVRYTGTLDGLAGLIADIFVAGVADGVTLISAAPDQDIRALAEATRARLAVRLNAAA